MTFVSPIPLPQWEHPTADSWISVTGNVQLEVYHADDEDPDRYAWWTVDFTTGRALKSGEAVGLENAMNKALASMPGRAS